MNKIDSNIVIEIYKKMFYEEYVWDRGNDGDPLGKGHRTRYFYSDEFSRFVNQNSDHKIDENDIKKELVKLRRKGIFESTKVGTSNKWSLVSMPGMIKGLWHFFDPRYEIIKKRTKKLNRIFKL